jgi:hypothetical protein
MFRLVILLAGVLGVACDAPPELSAGFHESLTIRGTCAGFLYAGSPDGDSLLVFKPGEGLGAIVADGGSRTYDFADMAADATLYAELGSDLVSGFCSSTATGDTDARYHPISGTAEFTVAVAQPGEYRADLTLTGIVLRKELASHEVSIPSLTVTGAEFP